MLHVDHVNDVIFPDFDEIRRACEELEVNDLQSFHEGVMLAFVTFSMRQGTHFEDKKGSSISTPVGVMQELKVNGEIHGECLS